MSKNLKNMLNSIPLPDSLDENIKIGFDRGENEKYRRKNKLFKGIKIIAASIIILISTISIIGLDKVEATIKQVLQYVPGYNLTIDKEEGEVLALQEQVLYEKDNIFVKIMAASKLGQDLSINIKGDYPLGHYSKENIMKDTDSMKIFLKDEDDNIISLENGNRFSGQQFWQGNYTFKVEGKGREYSLLIDQLEIPFRLEETKEVDNFLELGPYAEDKDITIVAIKKPLEDRIMISLLNKSEMWKVIEYPSRNAIELLEDLPALGVERSMYLVDKEGNKIFPYVPISYRSRISDFYFNISDRDGLKLVLPYLKIEYDGVKTKKVRLKAPKDREKIDINQVLDLGKFQLEIISIERQDEEVIISLDNQNLEDEILSSFLVDGLSAYSIHNNKDTGYTEIAIELEKIDRAFSIYFKSPTSLLLGNWEIDLD